jgi:PP-loop superfamily ATP-utilizing enzyme
MGEEDEAKNIKADDEKDTILVSFSGGRTSALMGRLIQISQGRNARKLLISSTGVMRSSDSGQYG